MKVIYVNGVRVHVFSNRLVKIYGKTRAISDATMSYIESELLLDNLFNKPCNQQSLNDSELNNKFDEL